MNEITIDELHAKMENKETYHHIDVRQPEEFEASRIDGAKLIPLGDLPSRLSEIENLKEEFLVVSCKSGGRSSRALMLLEEQGFKNVWNLVGGNDAWQAKYK